MTQRSLILTLALTSAALTGCQSWIPLGMHPITKTVLVRAVEADGTRVDPIVEFLGATDEFYLQEETKHCDPPLNWHTERLNDGTLRITWTTWKGARDWLYLNEAGFYPEVVPQQSITVIERRGQSSPLLRPVTVTMRGNTAYLPRKDRISYSKEFPSKQDPRQVR